MKMIKKKITYMVILFAAGAIMIGTALFKGGDSMLMGMGVGLAIVSLLKAVQFIRLTRNSEKMKQYEIMQNEERLILIVTRSGYATFLITVAIEYIVMLVLLLTGQEAVASIVAEVAGLQVFCYLIMYFLYNKKY